MSDTILVDTQPNNFAEIVPDAELVSWILSIVKKYDRSLLDSCEETVLLLMEAGY